jgi:hypothetical protein
MASLDLYLELLRRPSNDRSLTDQERLVCSVGDLASELEMGGLSAFLYNVSPSAAAPGNTWVELRETVRSLEAIGANKTAVVLASLLPLLETRAQGDGTWSGFLAARGVELDQPKAQLEDSDQLWAYLDSYLAP